MKTTLIVLATAFGLVFALASVSFAQDQRLPSQTGKLEDKSSMSGSGKTSLSLRGTPEVRGGTLDEGSDNGKVIFF